MQAVIMAGGVGSRLRPLTCTIPKPMVPLLDKPIMAYSIDLLKKYDIHNIAVTLQYLPELITGYFGDGHEFGVSLRYFNELTPLGTAGSVRNAREMLTDTFVVISGDALTDIDLRQAVSYHRQKGSLATIVLRRMDAPMEFGTVILKDQGNVDRFVEKPSRAQVFSDTVNTGIYILEPEVLKGIAQGKSVDFARDVFPELLNRGMPVFGYVTDGYWCDVGSVQTYMEAQHDALSGRCKLNIDGERTENGIWFAPGATVRPGAAVEGPCYLGRDATVESGAHVGAWSVIGKGSRVCSGASIKRSVLWEEVIAEKGAKVSGAVVCDKSIVRADAKLFEGAVVGSSTSVGRGSRVMPGAMVWPCKSIADDAIVRHNMVWQETPVQGALGDGRMQGVWGMDVDPAGLFAFTRALEQALGPIERVLIANDSSQLSQLAYDALSVAWRAQGCVVLAAGSAPMSLLRQELISAEADLGMMARVNADEIVIDVLDRAGLKPSRQQFKKVEESYYRSEFSPLTKGAAVQEEHSLHLGGWLSSLKLDNVSECKGETFAIAGDSLQCSCLEKLLMDMGMKVVVAGGREQLLEVVTGGSALAGFYMSGLGGIDIATPVGYLDESAEWDIALYMAAMIYKPKRLPVALQCSQSIEGFLQGMGIEPVRVGREEHALWEIIKDESEATAIMHLLLEPEALVLSLVKEWGKDREWLSKLPFLEGDICTVRRDIDIPHKDMGRVIRELSQLISEGNRLLVEGVRAVHPDGFALIMPHTHYARCQILCRGMNEEYASELADFYEQRVKELRDSEVKSTDRV